MVSGWNHVHAVRVSGSFVSEPARKVIDDGLRARGVIRCRSWPSCSVAPAYGRTWLWHYPARAYPAGADADCDRGLVTVGQWLELWLQTRQTLGFSTRRMYAQHIRDYLKPFLGSVPLAELTVGKAQAMFTSLIRLNGVRSKPLSPTTLLRIRGVLHAALNGAIRSGLITQNPAHWVELPPVRRPKAVVWTEPGWRTGGRPECVRRSRCGRHRRPRDPCGTSVIIGGMRCSI